MLEVMQDADQLGYEARFKQLQSALEESYDLPFMTRVARAIRRRSSGPSAPNCSPT
jgi:hypothetical protein